MADTYLEQIWNDKVDEIDILCLQKAISACYTGHKVEDVLRGLSQFELQLWRGHSKGKRFIIVTRVVQYPGGRQLEVWSIGGNGYVRAIAEAYTTLIDFCKEQECRWFSITIERPAFAKLYSRFPARKFTYMVQEV